eukprot:g18655.t1
METKHLPQARHLGGCNSESPLLSARAENTGTPRQHQHLHQHQHQQQEQQQQQDSNVDNGGREVDDSLSLPWLADRFYLNVLASLRDDPQSDWPLARHSKSGSGSVNCSSTNNDTNGNSDRSDRGFTEGGHMYENGPFFSLERLVDVVSGDGRPGIKAALFGTFSLEMGRMAKEIPSLFSTSNRTIPVLVLHGDKSLLRRPRRPSTSPRAAARVASTAPTASAAERSAEATREVPSESAAQRKDADMQEEVCGRGKTRPPSPGGGSRSVGGDCGKGGGSGSGASGRRGVGGGKGSLGNGGGHARADQRERGALAVGQSGVVDDEDHDSDEDEDPEGGSDTELEETEKEEEEEDEGRGYEEEEEEAGEGEEKGKRKEGAEGEGRQPEDYFLYRKGSNPNAPSWLREQQEAAGRLDRLIGWEMLMPGLVQVEKVDAAHLGVHHPKFGLLFLKDGSVVVYIGTGNMGVDTAIDATWVQRFGRREKSKSADGQGEGEGEGDGTVVAPGDPSCGEEGEGGGGICGGNHGDDRTTWEGDFADTLQGFLQKESRLMEDMAKRKRESGDGVAKRPLHNTPARFLFRELGIRRLEDHFDFTTAAVDLIPTAPADADAREKKKRKRLSLQRKQQEKLRRRQEKLEPQKRKEWRVSTPASLDENGSTPGRSPPASPAQAAKPLASRGRPQTTPPAMRRPLSAPPANTGAPVGSEGGGGKHGAGGGRAGGAAWLGAGADQCACEDRDAPSSGLDGGGGGDNGSGGPEEAREKSGAGETVAALFSYGQLRMRHVLSKRRQQVGEMGPEDLLILQPTSIGSGIDAGFMEVVAKNLMPDSVESLGRDRWLESRLNSVRIVWPSAQYMDFCRRDMSKSKFLEDRQSATTMEVDHEYVMGEPVEEDAGNGFVFMSPDNFDSMAPDLHACLHTFQLHPATALALPPRPAHVKSAMRLRRAPPLMHQIPPPSPHQYQQQQQQQHVTPAFESGEDGNVLGASRSSSGRPSGSIGEESAGADGAAGCNGGSDGDGGVCEHAQHFAWFLLTSACLSKGAQGEVTHCTSTGTTSGVEFKNVELGVLFHSGPDRAYYAPAPPDCSCRSCDLRRRRCRRARGPGTLSSLTPPLLPPRPKAARLGAPPPSPSNVLGQHGLADDGAATWAATVRTSAALAAGRTGLQRRGRPRRRPRPRPIPLPVPFCLDSESYADPEGDSPHARFAPFMQTLKKDRPWSAEVQRLLRHEKKKEPEEDINEGCNRGDGTAAVGDLLEIVARLEEGFDTDARSVDSRFHDIRFSAEVSKARATLMGVKAGVNEILKSFSGTVSSGQILAIIGASGTGKTSPLDVLMEMRDNYASIPTRERVCLGQAILLTMDQTANFGPAIDNLEHLTILGHWPEGLVNPADYLLERRGLGFLSSFRRLQALIARATLNSLRVYAAYAFRLVLFLCFSFFLGSV